MATRPIVKNSLIIAVSLAIALLAMNGEYWMKQAKYLFSKEDLALNGDERMEPDMLLIEHLGIKAPIVEAESNNETEFQKALSRGVVRYPNGARVGELGNVYIFGHSSDYLWKEGEYRTVFALLPKISVGDIIVASDQAGRVFRYTVRETKVISPNDTSVLSQYGRLERILTLQASYPVGTALKRFIVIAQIE